MKLFSKVKTLVSKVPKKLVALFAVALLAIGGFGVAQAEFWPARPTYDYNKAPLNGSTCVEADDAAYNRCGSMNGPEFNSFINTPSYGDERTFFDAARTDQTAAGSYKNVLPDVDGGSREVVLRTYVHNNANQNTNTSGLGVAKNAKVRIELPTAEAQVLRAHSYISADNATTVEDTADLTSSYKFKVEYIAGSAKMYNFGPFQNGVNLSDSVVTTGAPIGYDRLDGNLPGCFDYAGVVEIRVRIMVKENPALKITKKVRMAGTKEWKKEVAAKPGDKVEWLINTESIGTAVNNNIITRDQPAPNTQLVPGSVKWIDAAHNAVQPDKPLFDGGFIAGNYAPGGNFLVTYASTITGDFEGCSVRVRNLAFSRSSEVNEIGDDADVVITKENCNPPTPKNPGVSIDKKVDGVEKKTVGVNQEFTYQLVVKNTGDVALTNVKVSDNAPANVQFISTDKGSIAGNKLSYTISSLAVGASETINIKAKVTAEVAGDIVNTACVDAPEVNPNNPGTADDCDDATVNVPTPIYSCDLLTANKVGENKYRFATAYTARNGASFKNVSYNYGDGTSASGGATTEHTYTKDGTYKIVATVAFTVNGVDKTSTGPACETQVDIAPKVTPEYSCDLLTAEKVSDRQYRFTVKFTAKNGANLKIVSFDYGDGSEKFVTNSTTATHNYTKDGTFVTRAVLTIDVNGDNKTVESDKCAAPVTLTSTPTTTPPTTVLPNTGAGNIFGLFAATSLIGAFMHRVYIGRKASQM